jgi:MprA protease rhombosortase-interaction domain-containing protein
MSRQTLSFLFLASAIVFLVLAIVTLLPFPSSTISDLGYQALCPFAPWSTLMLLLLGGIGWALRRHVKAQA